MLIFMLLANFISANLNQDESLIYFSKPGETEDYELFLNGNTVCQDALTVGNILQPFYKANFNINATATIDINQNVEFQAGAIIVLEKGFFAKSQSTFLAEIDVCGN